MSTVVVLRLNGDFDHGFSASLEVGEEGSRPLREIKGSLPSNPKIYQKYEQYQGSYRSLDGRVRGVKVSEGIDRVSIPKLRQDCSDSVKEVGNALNTWLKSETFRSIHEELLVLMRVNPLDEVVVLIRTDYRPIQRLPWNLWDLIERSSNIEVVLSSPN